MRVLTVGNLYPPHDLGGGYELVWHSAAEHLRACGHEVRVLCSDHREPRAGAETDPDVHRGLEWYWHDHSFPRRSLRSCARLERHNAATLRQHLDSFSPDVVTWWSMGGMSMGMLEQVRRLGIAAVAFVHDDWLDYGRRTDGWHRRWRSVPRPAAHAIEAVAGVPAKCDFDHAARYVFVSRRTLDRALEAGLDLRDVGIAHSGIDPSLLGPAPEADWSWSLLYVGRIDRRKGINTAVEALVHLPQEATLTVVGDGDPETVEATRKWAVDLGVHSRLSLAGHQDRVALRGSYDRADAVVFPVTWEEPWGLVPLEAMARGRPVVATGRGGSADYLRNGDNCILFAAGDAHELAQGVVRLSRDENLRRRLRESGLTTASQHTEDAFNAAVVSELTTAVKGSR